MDPSFDYPLPIGGLDILDFNFLNKNLQFALLFAGVFGAGNIQRPNLWGGRFDASVDFFWLAVKSNDSVFDARGELTAERVRHLPASTGLNLGFQATAFQKLVGHYELKYDALFARSQDGRRFHAAFEHRDAGRRPGLRVSPRRVLARRQRHEASPDGRGAVGACGGPGAGARSPTRSTISAHRRTSSSPRSTPST